jgi:hypothetical protein
MCPQDGKGQSSPKPPSPDGLARPEELYRAPSIRERQAAMAEIEREARKAREPEEEKLALAEVAEDFKRLQLVNNRMMSATMSAATPDYKNIAEATGEIRKHALRLRKNLQLPKAEGAKESKETWESRQPPALDAAGMKAALLSLDACIMKFIENPIFANPNVIDFEQAVRARKDLEKIIGQSQLISKAAEELRKSNVR